MMNLSKQSQVGKYGKKKKYKKPKTPESELQAFADEYLKIKGIDYIRIPDSIFTVLAVKAPFFMKGLGGHADNICFIPIADDYCISLHLELKTKTGKLHGKQKANAKKLNWKIARSTKEIQDIIDKFEQDVEKIKGMT